jgi:hypothetical protein
MAVARHLRVFAGLLLLVPLLQSAEAASTGQAVAGQPAAAPGQPPAASLALSGRVVDARTGVPIPGALVRAIEPDTSVLTGEDGAFVLDNLPPGRLTLQVVMLGFALLERVLDIGPSTPPVTLALTETPPSFSEHVEVTGDPFPVREVAVPSEIAIGASDLALLRGILADDPFRAVQAMPGVTSGDDFTAEFAIRGSGPSHIGVLVDGVPAPVVLHTVQGRSDTGSVSMVNSDVLSEVVVSGGAYPPRTGNRTGAQVEFLTREGSRERTQVKGVLGAAIASVVAEGPIGSSRRASWLVAGRGSYAGWIVRRIDPGATTAFTFLDVNSSLSWDVAQSHELSLVAIAGRMWVDENDDNTGLNSLDHAMNDSAFVLGTWRWQFAPRLVITQKVDGLYNRFSNLNPYDTEIGRGRIGGGGYRASATWTAGDRLVVDSGGSVDVQHQELQLRRLNSRPPLSVPTERVDATERLLGGYVVVTGTPRSTITWSAGARGDWSQLADAGAFGPFGNLAWGLSEQWRLRGGIGRYAQFPDATQLAGLRAGGGLEPTLATHYDVAAEFRPRPSLRWQAGFYQRLERDALRLPDSEPRLVNGRPTPGSVTTKWENRIDTTSRGIELLFQRRQPVGVSGWVSYSYALTRDHDIVSGERYRGDYDQRHTLNVYVSWRASHRMGASLKYRLGSNYPVDGYYQDGPEIDGEPTYVLGTFRNLARYPTYSRVDARVQRSFIRGQRRLTLFVEALNVLNRDNFGPAGPGNAEPLFPVLPSAGVSVEF